MCGEKRVHSKKSEQRHSFMKEEKGRSGSYCCLTLSHRDSRPLNFDLPDMVECDLLWVVCEA